MLTRNQIIHIYSTAREAGISHDDAKAELCAVYDVTSSRELTYNQYREYIRHLEALKSEQSQAARQAAPQASPEGKPAAGYYSSHAQLYEFVQGAREFKRLWELTSDQDVACLAFLLDKFRLYRVRDKRLSHHQVHTLVDKIAQFPLNVFRRSYQVYVDGKTAKPEEYFIGIMAHVCRDARREQDAFTGDLALT
jgi:hypothetical protein